MSALQGAGGCSEDTDGWTNEGSSIDSRIVGCCYSSLKYINVYACRRRKTHVNLFFYTLAIYMCVALQKNRFFHISMQKA